MADPLETPTLHVREGATLRPVQEDDAAEIFALIEATRRSGARELALIGAQDALVNPQRTFPAEPLD
jgi:pyridoxal/pyridoxine/pyridoxamine kinase